MSHNAKTDSEFLASVRDWFRLTSEAEAKHRAERVDDIKFVRLGGEHQWTPQALQARNIPGQERPALTYNWCKRYRTTIINGIRENTPAVKVRPVDDKADKKTAEILQGVMRNIENGKVRAADAIHKASEFAVDCGLGYFGVITDYSSHDSFDQEIQYRLIPDAFKVYFDPLSVMPDGSDARKAMIVEEVSRTVFERENGKIDDVSGWQDGAEGDTEWLSEKTIRVAEYYEVVEEKEKIILTSDGRTVWESDAHEEDVQLAVSARQASRKRCKWWKIAGNKVLSKGVLPTQYIPIIPVYGEESWCDGERIIMGSVRPAKDPARMFNFWVSSLAEQVAQQPKSPWTGPEGFMEGNEVAWASANVTNIAALEYKAYDEQGRPMERPSREPPPQIPTGYTEQMQVALDGVRAAFGMEDPMVGAGQSPDQSGRAIRSLMEQGAVATSHYAGNLAKSVAHAGRIILEMIPVIYDTKQVIRIIGEDGEVDHATHDPELDAAYMEDRDEQTGEVRKIYNLSVGRYDCTAVAGPSYSTKRQEGFDSLTQLAQAMPQLPQLAGDLLMKISDIPYADMIAGRIKAAIPPHIVAADDDEADPQVLALKQRLEQAMAQINAMQAEIETKSAELQLSAGELEIKRFEAETKRMAVLKPESGGGGMSEIEVDERMARLLMDAERNEREQEAHERAMQAPFPVPQANKLQGDGPIN